MELLEDYLRNGGGLALRQRLPHGLTREAVQPHASINAAIIWLHAKIPERYGISLFNRISHPPGDGQ